MRHVLIKKCIIGLAAVLCFSFSGITATAAAGVVTADKFDYLIITNEALYKVFMRLANYCTSREGLETRIFTTEQIDQWYSQINSKKKRVRQFIIDCQNNYGIRYVLLGGDTNVIPGYEMQGEAINHDDTPILTDLYYSGFDSDWTYSNGKQAVDFYANVALGRAPVKNGQEAVVFVDKTIRYKMYTWYRSNILLVGERLVSDLGPYGMGSIALEKARDILENSMVRNYDFDTVYDACQLTGGNGVSYCYWEPSELRDTINTKSYNLVLHLGHGSPEYLMKQDDPDVGHVGTSKFQNRIYPFILYSLACYSAAFDGKDYDIDSFAKDGNCVGEELITAIYSGAAAVIGNTRNGIGDTDQVESGPTINLMNEFTKNMASGGNKRLGDILESARQACAPSGMGQGGEVSSWAWALAELTLLGDPTLEIQ